MTAIILLWDINPNYSAKKAMLLSWKQFEYVAFTIN